MVNWIKNWRGGRNPRVVVEGFYYLLEAYDQLSDARVGAGFTVVCYLY